MLNITNIPAPRVEFIDPRTGLMSREWYRFFINLFYLTGNGSSDVTIPEVEAAVNDLAQAPVNVLAPQVTELQKQTDAVYIASLASINVLTAQIAELQKQVNALRMQVQPQLGTFAALQQDNLPWAKFDTTPQSVPPDVGTLAWDGGTTLGVQATANVLMRVGESEFVYVKASATITKGQLCYHTGAVGSSGVITAAPTPLALSDPNQIVGVAAENIALNDFGLIQVSGDLRGFNTTGSSVGEVWADGDPLYYNPAYVGSLTKVKPSAPNQKTYVGEVVNAGSGGSGSIHIRIVPGSVLGGTDSNVQITSVANNDLLQYDAALGYWKNVAASSISVSAPVTKTADFSVAAGETWIINNKSGSTCTVTLPTASANTGRTLTFQNYQAQLLVSASSNVVPLGGGSAGTAILDAVVGNWATMVSDGTNWVVMQDAPNNALLIE